MRRATEEEVVLTPAEAREVADLLRYLVAIVGVYGSPRASGSLLETGRTWADELDTRRWDVSAGVTSTG